MAKTNLMHAIQNGQTKGMVNAYICSNLHCLVTKNMDHGHIPERIACPKCDEMCVTMMYMVNQTFEPQVEWFKPSQNEMQASMLSMTPEDAKNHHDYIMNGGLVSRQAKHPSFTKKEK
jgi:hypothetical protein